MTFVPDHRLVASPRAPLGTRQQAIMLESRNAHKRGDSHVLAYASSDLLAYLLAKIKRMNIKTTYYFLTGKKLEVNLTQMGLHDLYHVLLLPQCRVTAFVLKVPIWHEYLHKST